MSGLREHGSSDSIGGNGACTECESNPPVGPCAACDSMICGDCGVLTKDPSGQRCICISCARLIAAVGERPARRKSRTSLIAVAMVVVFGLAVIGGMFALG